jgi:hypothetical protein
MRRQLWRQHFTWRCRWIRGRRHIPIQKPLVARISRRVAIAVACVSTAMPRHLLFLGRPHILPNRRISNSAGRGQEQILRPGTSRRRRARVVVNPKHHIGNANMLANVIRGNHGDAVALIHRNSRTINVAEGNICRLLPHPEKSLNSPQSPHAMPPLPHPAHRQGPGPRPSYWCEFRWKSCRDREEQSRIPATPMRHVSQPTNWISRRAGGSTNSSKMQTTCAAPATRRLPDNRCDRILRKTAPRQAWPEPGSLVQARRTIRRQRTPKQKAMRLTSAWLEFTSAGWLHEAEIRNPCIALRRSRTTSSPILLPRD